MVYFLSAFGLLLLAYLVFRVIVRRDYRRRGRLTPLSSMLDLLVWSVLIFFPYTYNQASWPWFWLYTGSISQILGFILIVAGLALAFVTMFWFGLRRAFGFQVSELIRVGPYRFSRNPQIVGGALMVLGVGLQWPSIYTLGWLLLFAVVSHLMVLTEEEHLLRVFGEAYREYCAEVPRYVGLFGR
jgi:protein-S-isoprenylcysteine O-methyltransferase Ste14